MLRANVTAVFWSIMSVTIVLDIILYIDRHVMGKSELPNLEIDIE